MTTEEFIKIMNYRKKITRGSEVLASMGKLSQEAV